MKQGARTAYDPGRDTWNLDLEILERALPERRPLLREGHLSHLLGVDLAIVFRCHPEGYGDAWRGEVGLRRKSVRTWRPKLWG